MHFGCDQSIWRYVAPALPIDALRSENWRKKQNALNSRRAAQYPDKRD